MQQSWLCIGNEGGKWKYWEAGEGGFSRGSVKNHLQPVTEVQGGQHTGTWVSLDDRWQMPGISQRLQRGARNPAPCRNPLMAIFGCTRHSIRAIY